MFRKLLKVILRFIGIILVVNVLSVLLVLFLVWQMSPSIPDSGVLRIDLSKGFTERLSGQSQLQMVIDSLLGESEPLSLVECVTALERARSDRRVREVLITGSFANSETLTIGLSGIRELGKALEQLGASKTVTFWMENPTLPDVYLAAHCKRRIMHPDGSAFFGGIGGETLFMGDALKRFGVEIYAPRAGEFKSAVEPWTRAGYSDEARAQQTQLIQELWGRILGDLEQYSGISATQWQLWSDTKGFLSPDLLKEHNFISETLYPDELYAHYQERYPEGEDFARIDLGDYLKMSSEPTMSAAKVGILVIEGVMSGEDDDFQIDGARIARQLRQLRREGELDGLIVRVNSPGGSSYAAALMERELSLIAAQIPVMISMGQYAASGGYWITTPVSTVFADPLTITGSIGVFSLIGDVNKAGEAASLHWEGIYSSELSGLLSPFKPKKDSDILAVQTEVDLVYERFLSKVSIGRQLERAQVEAIAGGRVWTGQRAHEYRLVTDVGGFASTITAMKGRVGDVIEWVYCIDELEAPLSIKSLIRQHAQTSLPEVKTVVNEVGFARASLGRPLAYWPERLTF
jgi:protease-4